MRAGDEIVAIDGRRDISYKTLILKVALSGHGQVLHFGVKRPGHDGLIEMDIQPVREANNDHPTIGILPAEGLSIGAFLPPSGMVEPPAYPELDRLEADEFNDTLAAAGPADQEPEALASHDDYQRLLARYRDRPIKHVIERRSASVGDDGPVQERVELTLPPAPFPRLRPATDRRADQRHAGRLARGVGRLPRRVTASSRWTATAISIPMRLPDRLLSEGRSDR